MLRKVRFALHAGCAKRGFGSATPRPVGLRGLGVKHPLELTFPDHKGYIDTFLHPFIPVEHDFRSDSIEGFGFDHSQIK
ncbi:hypothetical protein L6452_01877 [Arctium lappa]|uniref:Uncharacterized protein n=1 Tax=Arctium lappa TaxID=4217 RepID=A0ACB9FI09_ARCLA|nr:hypothetical protein L6452_01877 [Arctium lappa]